MEEFTTVDVDGHTVRLGDSVKIVDLDMCLFDALEPDEIEDVRSMIGSNLSVEQITASGYVYVTKWFDRGHGRHESHTLCVSPQQVALVVASQTPN